MVFDAIMAEARTTRVAFADHRDLLPLIRTRLSAGRLPPTIFCNGRPHHVPALLKPIRPKPPRTGGGPLLGVAIVK